MAELQKSLSYSATGDAPQESVERINKRLTSEMRSRLRQVGPAPVGSERWGDVAEHLHHLAALAVMEEFQDRLGSGSVLQSTASQSDLGKSQQSTVWEKDVICTRLIVEEGKINLLMRMMAEHKQEAIRLGGSIDGSGNGKPLVRSYEIGLGIVLRSGLTVVEAIQTLDVRALLDHIALSIDSAMTEGTPFLNGETDDVVMQEFLCITYLGQVLDKLGSTNEDMIMSHFSSINLFPKVLAHVGKYAQFAIDKFATPMEATKTSVEIPTESFGKELATAYCSMFAALFDSDTYKASVASFFPGKVEKAAFVQLIDPILKTVMGPTPSAEVKRRFRPVTDFVLRHK